MLKTVVTTLLLATGCSVGSVNGPGEQPDGGGADPRAATFDSTVKPIFEAKGCTAGGTCHGNGTQLPNFGSFMLMTTNGPTGRYIAPPPPTGTNIIITKDVPTPGMHQNLPYLDATDKTTVSTWLDSGP